MFLPDYRFMSHFVSDLSRDKEFDRMYVAAPLLGSTSELTVFLVSISRRARKSSPVHPRIHGIIK